MLTDTTVTKSGTKYYFENLEIKEGQYVTYSFTQDEGSNPKAVFEIPDADIDTTTISVTVRPSSSNSQITIYNKATDILDITGSSEVYFLQESRGGKYKIYFGDDIIGKKINDGAIVTVNYLSTNGPLANKASEFTVSSSIGAYTDITVTVVNVAAGGTNRESVNEVKYNAVSQFATQNRLVTFKDYESYITKNYPSLESISVWGGEDENPPIYGKVFLSIKPKTDYYISESEKKRIIADIITPKSIVAVQTEFRDPEYLYLLINNYIQYDPKKTTLSDAAIKTNVRNAVLSYRNDKLNRFTSKFVLSKMQDYVDSTNLNSIIGSEATVRLQKRFLPTLGAPKNYAISFNAALHRGTITNKMTSTNFNVYDSFGVERTVQFDEIPQSYSGITSIGITDAGSGYTSAPTVTITGDGSGATAEAIIVNGRVQNINILDRGVDYTRAIVTISGGNGYGAKATALVDGKVGTLRLVYYDTNAQRQVVNENVGNIYYDTGEIEIFDLNILSVDSTDGYIRLSLESDKGIIETIKNTIITIDETDPTSITTDLVKVSV